MADETDVRIGEYLYRLAGGYFEETGLRPLRERWGSLFPGRQNVSGAPGVQNVNDDDLRWLADSFAGGEGQRVIDPTDDQSFRSFDRANNIDFSQPGEMRLGKRMEHQSSTGAAPTTIQGSTWADDIGASTVVGNDRRLNALNDAIKVDAVLGAGQFQIDFHAFVEASTTIEGSALTEEKGNTAVSGSDIRLKSDGAVVRTVNQDPIDGSVGVAVTLVLPAPSSGKNTATVNLAVWNQTNDSKINQKRMTLEAKAGDPDATATIQVSFTAKAGKTYRYKVVCLSLSKNAPYVTVDKLTIGEGTATARWEVKNGAALVASGTVQMSGLTATQKVASASVPGGATYTLRVVRLTGGHRLLVDRAVTQVATIADPRLLEVGKGDRPWIVDAAGRILFWDAAAADWNLVSTLAGGTAKAIAHSDSYQFVGMSDKRVYRATDPSTGEAYTVAMADSIEGLIVGGSRLLILTESTASGTRIFDAGLQATPAVTPTERYAVGNAGMVPVDDVPQRMAAIKSGAVFFANQGPECWVYTWDGLSGTPYEKLPPGFRARSVVHSGGFTYVGGGFPTVDANGDTHQRPAVFEIDHSRTGAAQLDVKLHRDEDPSTKIQAMQLFGRNLYVLCSVATDPPKMRLWRISLADPIAPFLEHEITLPATGGEARGLAITEQETFLAWSTGGPWRRSTGYNIAEPAVYNSSRYHFGLTEKKRLDAVEVVGIIPTGCQVQVAYEIDDSGTFVPIELFTTPGRAVVSIPNETILFRSLRFEVRLFSPSEAFTPSVFTIGLQAYLPSYDKRFELLIACFDETAVWHMDGSQARGAEGINYLKSLADSGALVEFENKFEASDAREYTTTVVSVQNPDIFYLRRGEALIRVVLAERAA